MGNKSIVLTNVNKRHGTHHTLKDISLTVAEGEILVVCGPSGAGKTSLLRIINGLDMPDSGEATVDGNPISGAAADLPALRARVGMVFQDLNLYPHLTVRRNIMLAPLKVRKMTKPDARALADRLLDKVGLTTKGDTYPAELSGGEMQRVAIARSLAMDPAILLLDEPTSALDPELTGDILDLVAALADDGITMVLVTHQMALARRIANRMVFMDKGEIIETGDPTQLIAAPRHERTRRFMARILHSAGDKHDA